MQPDEWRSFQNRFEGWAYACPDVAVVIPGFRPMKMQSRSGASTSWSSGRWAYVEGGA